MGKCISILGSTGSIGTQSLEVAKAHDMQVHALAANRNITLLEQQTREYHPKKVCIFEESQYQDRKSTRLNSSHIVESRMPSSA